MCGRCQRAIAREVHHVATRVTRGGAILMPTPTMLAPPRPTLNPNTAFSLRPCPLLTLPTPVPASASATAALALAQTHSTCLSTAVSQLSRRLVVLSLPAATAAAAASAAALARSASAARACSIRPLASATGAASVSLRAACFAAACMASSSAVRVVAHADSGHHTLATELAHLHALDAELAAAACTELAFTQVRFCGGDPTGDLVYRGSLG
jgi:hypothetical protein